MFKRGVMGVLNNGLPSDINKYNIDNNTPKMFGTIPSSSQRQAGNNGLGLTVSSSSMCDGSNNNSVMSAPSFVTLRAPLIPPLSPDIHINVKRTLIPTIEDDDRKAISYDSQSSKIHNNNSFMPSAATTSLSTTTTTTVNSPSEYMEIMAHIQHIHDRLDRHRMYIGDHHDILTHVVMVDSTGGGDTMGQDDDVT
jgi:hypothetical protein